MAANSGDESIIRMIIRKRIGMLITVTLYYWRVAAALDVGKQFAQPCVRDSLILIVDIVLHLKVV